jgi:hypothetical protein
MKLLYLLPLFLFSFNRAQAQLLSGQLLDEHRKLLTHTNFTITGNYDGAIVYELSVNRKGKVTSERLILEQSNIKSTPANIQARKFLRSLTFQEGTHFPADQHVVVRVNFVQQLKATPVTPAAK